MDPQSASTKRNSASLFAGVFLCAALILSSVCSPTGYLNQITVTTHLLAYGFLCWRSYFLHKVLREKTNGNYPIGPAEVVVLMLVPFFYIIWNGYWLHKAADYIHKTSSKSANEHKAPSPIQNQIAALAFSACSVACYPDNIAVFPILVAPAAFFYLFLSIEQLIKKAHAADLVHLA